jgi:hypothetical protein
MCGRMRQRHAFRRASRVHEAASKSLQGRGELVELKAQEAMA